MANDEQSAAPENASDEPSSANPPKTTSKFWSRFKSAMRFVRTIPAGRMLVLVLVAALLLSPIAGGLFWQRIQSKFDDWGWFYDPSEEGLIVVDSPQVFTRERLVNQRLRDSAWIDRQLEAVDRKLANGDFSKPDILESQEQSLRLLQQSLNSGGSDNPANPDGTENTGTGTPENSNLENLLALIQPDPISVFRDAQFYREMLTQSRYEAILDDAHDIGSNTLQKLNFRMTITPARRKSDSLAAVTITIEEPEDVENLFQYYGKLLIETREEVEDTVRRLTQDRSLVLRRGAQYTYSDRITSLLDQVLDERFEKSFGTRPTQEIWTLAINAAAELEQKQRLSDTSETIRMSIMQVREIPGLARMLYPGQRHQEYSHVGLNSDVVARDGDTLPSGDREPGSTFEQVSATTASQNCNRSLSLLDLAAPVFEDQELTARMRQELDETFAQNDVLQRQKANRSRSQQGKPPIAQNRLTGPEQTEILEARFAEFMNAKRFRSPCPQDTQIHARAKLRVIGALRLLEPALGQTGRCLGTSEEDKATVIRHTLSLFMMPSNNSQKLACGIDTRTLMAQRPVGLNGWDIGRIGVSYLIKAELATTPIDSMIRVRNLSDYFRFSIDKCTPLACSVTVRTLAEDKMYRLQDAKRNGIGSAAQPGAPEQATSESALYSEINDDLSQKLLPATSVVPDFKAPDTSGALADHDLDRIREIGREEALRLYAELSCFARARSYTVWPRSGETKRALSRNSSQIALLGDFFSTMTAGANANSTSASYTETQHVFGIGDGGQPAVSAFPECDAPFYWMLDRFEPNGDFVSDFADLDGRKWKHADPAIKAWRNRVICRIANGRQGRAMITPGKLDTLAAGQRTRATQVLDQAQTDRIKQGHPVELRAQQLLMLQSMQATGQLVDLRMVERPGIPGWDNLDCDQNPETLEEHFAKRKMKSFVKHVAIGDFMALTRAQRNYDTNVSWIVIPEQESAFTPKRHVAKSVPLSAIVSLPSWWPSAKITIRTCWIRPKAMKRDMSGADFCKPPEEATASSNNGLGSMNQMSRQKDTHTSESVFPVRLPSNAQDVLQKLGFFIIRAPYLDNQNTSQEVFVVQAGRSAAIRLTGKRLWKNPRVRLGNQWHDEIEVLPDMKGIIARFRCVEPTSDTKLDAVEWPNEILIDTKMATEFPKPDPGGRPGSASRTGQPGRSNPAEQRMARVWTSEGATSFAEVSVLPFRPSYTENGVHESPCWPDQRNIEKELGAAPDLNTITQD